MPAPTSVDPSASNPGASSARSDFRTKSGVGLERSRSTLSADSPAWQPSATLAISALKGLTLGGTPVQRSLGPRPSGLPSQDVRKAGSEWSVQLPEGFMEAPLSPVGGVARGYEQGESGRKQSHANGGPSSELSGGFSERVHVGGRGKGVSWPALDGMAVGEDEHGGVEVADVLDAEQKHRVASLLRTIDPEGEEHAGARLGAANAGEGSQVGQTSVEQPTGWTLTEVSERGEGGGKEGREAPGWREPQLPNPPRGHVSQAANPSLWKAAEAVKAPGWPSYPSLGPTEWRETSRADAVGRPGMPPEDGVKGPVGQQGGSRGAQLAQPGPREHRADPVKLPAAKSAPPGFQTANGHTGNGTSIPPIKQNAVVSQPSQMHKVNGPGSLGPPGFLKANAAEATASLTTSSTVEAVYAEQKHVRNAIPGTPSQLVLSRVFMKQTLVDEEPRLRDPTESIDVQADVGKRSPSYASLLKGAEDGVNGLASEIQTWFDRPATAASHFAHPADRVNGFGRVMVEDSGAPDGLPPNRPVSSSSYAQSRRSGPDGLGREGPQWEAHSESSGRTQDVRLEGQQEWRKAVGSGRTQRETTPAPMMPDVLRRLLPQGSDQLAASVPHANPAASTQSVSPPPHFHRQDAPVPPAHQENGDRSTYTFQHPHWTPPHLQPPPQLYPTMGNTLPPDGLMHQPSSDPSLNPWANAHPHQYPQQGPYRSESDAQHGSGQFPAQGDHASQPRLPPPPNSHPLHSSSWQAQAESPAGFATAQTPSLSALQNDPHLLQLRATVQQNRMRREGGNTSAGPHPPPTGWNGRPPEEAQSEYGFPRQNPHGMQNGEASTYSGGGSDYLRIQTPAEPLAELVGPLGSLLPKEKPSPGARQSGQTFGSQDYGHDYAQQRHPYAEPGMPTSFYCGGDAGGAAVPLDPSYGRPSVSPESAQRMAPQWGTGSSRDRKSTYNPMRWQAAQAEPSKTSQDSVSDADLLRLLESSQGDAEEAGAEWERSGDMYGDTRNGSVGEGGGLYGVGEPSNGVDFGTGLAGTPVADAGAGGGVNGGPRTAAEVVAARAAGADEEQFEADLKAAMNLSLEDYKMQETTDYLVAQATSWPSLRKTAPHKENVGRGLANKTGEYNCFLNVVIQSLWHLLPFRESVAARLPLKRRLSPKHPAWRHMAVLRGLFTIFRALSADGGKPTAVDPSTLRTALHNAHAGSDLFQIEEMNDASEVLLSLFTCVHEALQAVHSQPPVSAAPTHDGLLPTPAHGAQQGNKAGALFKAEDVCSSGCYVHDLFGLDMMEYTDCTHCRKRSHELHYQQFFHLVNCSTLSDVTLSSPGLPFAPLLSRVLHSATPLRPCDKDQGGCGHPTPTTHWLDRPPELFTVALVWANAEASQSQVRSVVNAISTRICVADIFPNLRNRGNHTLRCVVCYYGLHYFAFAFNDKAQQWLLLDDTNVKAVGPWEKVVEQCTSGRLQPSVLFYQAQRD